MSDFRIKTEFFDHPKTQRLLRFLDADGVLALLRLWSFTATTYPDGMLRDMDADDIETAAKWAGDRGVFYAAITAEKMRFLDSPETDGEDHYLHDWEEHQPWVANAPARKKKARRAANKRWSLEKMEKGTGIDSVSSIDSIGSNATSMPGACPEHARSNAPLLSSPFPSSPFLTFPNKETPLPPFEKGAVVKVEKSLSKNPDPGFETFWQAYPKKIGKGAARKSFLKIRPNEKLLETMIGAIVSARETEQWKKDGGQFIPMPTTWLNQERWGDEHAPKKTGSDFSRRVDESIRSANEIYKGVKNVE